MNATPPNLVRHDGHVSKSVRAGRLGQQPLTIWLTGLSGAGKSTLAFGLEQRLIEANFAAYVLDGDNIRHGLSSDLGFSEDDRTENIRRVAEVAALMNDAGLIVVTAFISPLRSDRALARRIIGEDSFMEVHVAAPLAVCEQRDPKGLYHKARLGQIPDFTGISAPYEVPETPHVSVHTEALGVSEAIGTLVEAVTARIRPQR